LIAFAGSVLASRPYAVCVNPPTLTIARIIAEAASN
jgi:hypothetical protein